MASRTVFKKRWPPEQSFNTGKEPGTVFNTGKEPGTVFYEVYSPEQSFMRFTVPNSL